MQQFSKGLNGSSKKVPVIIHHTSFQLYKKFGDVEISFSKNFENGVNTLGFSSKSNETISKIIDFLELTDIKVKEENGKFSFTTTSVPPTGILLKKLKSQENGLVKHK